MCLKEGTDQGDYIIISVLELILAIICRTYLYKFLMRIHFTNGRGTKELRRRFGHGMDRNAYISLRAWHLSTSIYNPDQ